MPITVNNQDITPFLIANPQNIVFDLRNQVQTYSGDLQQGSFKNITFNWPSTKHVGQRFTEGNFDGLEINTAESGFYFEQTNFTGDLSVVSSDTRQGINFAPHVSHVTESKTTFKGCTFTYCNIKLNGRIGFINCTFKNTNILDCSTGTDTYHRFGSCEFDGGKIDLKDSKFKFNENKLFKNITTTHAQTTAEKVLKVSFQNCKEFENCNLVFDFRLMDLIFADKEKEKPYFHLFKGCQLNILNDENVQNKQFLTHAKLENCIVKIDGGINQIKNCTIVGGSFTSTSGIVNYNDNNWTESTFEIKNEKSNFTNCYFLPGKQIDQRHKLSIASSSTVTWESSKIDHCDISATTGSLQFKKNHFIKNSTISAGEVFFYAEFLHNCHLDISYIIVEKLPNTDDGYDPKKDVYPNRIENCSFSSRVHTLTLKQGSVTKLLSIKIPGNILFQGTDAKVLTLRKVTPESEGDFQWDFMSLNLGYEGKFSFVDCELQYANFFGWDFRDTEKINIKDCSWGDREFSQLVMHEKLVKTEAKTKGKQLEGMYRALKQKYEDEGNKPQSGDFHFWEQKLRLARLKRDDPGSMEYNLLALYKVFAGFGEDISLLFMWWFVIILMFPLIISLYAYGCSAHHYFDTLLNSVLILTPGATRLVPTEIFDQWGLFGKSIFFLEAIFFAIQTALLVLGIRRRMLR